MPKFILKITAESAENCIDEKNVECFILSASLPEDCLGRIIRKIEVAGKIALLEGEDAAALAVKLGADGIVADLSASTAIKRRWRPCAGSSAVVFSALSAAAAVMKR